jgi:hypothetical protein
MPEERQLQLAPYVIGHAEAISKRLGWVADANAGAVV